jgi:hypothetical protein
MQKYVLIAIVIVLSALGGILIKEQFFSEEPIVPHSFSEPAKMERKMILVSQVASFADIYGFYWVKLAGTTRFLYSWSSTQEYGIDIPENWKWNFVHGDRTVTATAPSIRYFGPKVDLSKTKYEVVKNGWFVDDDDAISTLNKKINEVTQENGKQALQDESIKKLARLSLEQQLLEILQQANPELGLLKVSISFEDS